MLDPGELTLRGAQVRLRPLCSDDAVPLAAAAAESPDAPVASRAMGAEQYVARALGERAAGRRYPFAVVWGGRIVGSTSYRRFQPWTWPLASDATQHDTPDATEIGDTWLAASAQRTACNTESKLLLLTQAFDAWKVLRVSFRTDARNARSRRAIERLGAAFEGILRANEPGADATVRDTACYSVLAAEWPYVSERLRDKLGRYAAHDSK
jgi:N-acetyltransferase